MLSDLPSVFNPFWVHLCMWCKKVVHFHFLHVPVNFPNTICLTGCIYPIVNSCPLCHRLIDHIGIDLFLGFLFYFIGLCVCFHASFRALLFWLVPCSIVWYRVAWYLQQCCSFTKPLWLSRVFYGSVEYINYRIVCSSSVQRATGSLVGIALNL